MPLLSRFFFRVLDRTKRLDYLWLFLVCAFPSGLSVLLDLHRSYPSPAGEYVGFLQKSNTWPLAFIIPVGLYLIRRIMCRIADIAAPEMPRRPPAIIGLLPDQDAQRRVYQAMRAWMGSPRMMATVLALTVMITVLDMRELLTVFMFAAPVRPDELDWSVMYQIGVVSKPVNLMFVTSAYLVQYLITFVGVFGMTFLVFHNLFFVRRVYQRRNVPAGQESDYIRIDLNDVNRCFGFRSANDAFNTQVIGLIIAGVIIMTSRFANAGSLEAGLSAGDLLTWPSPLFQFDRIGDMGQTLLAGFWLFALGVVSLPAIVKLLPRLPIGAPNDNPTITGYLREFLDDSAWRYGEHPTNREIDLVAAQFSQNSFWPTGDNRASQLFFFSFMVLLVVLFPTKTNDVLVLTVSLVIMGVVAWLLKTLMFFLLNSSLAYVDERLAKPRPELIAQMEERRVTLRQKLFISYRRDDTNAYARLLRSTLLNYMDAKDIFIDVEAIRDGEDFVDVIRNAVESSDTMLVLIGRDWLRPSPATGQNRLHDPDDFVRLEIRLALEAGRRVIPVLVGDAIMPTAEDLPEDLEPLWRRNARKMSDTHWEYDVEALVKSIADDR